MLNKKCCKIAFTVAEVLIALVIIGILGTVLIRDVNLKKNQYYNNFMSYSAFTNLDNNVQIVLNEGCTAADVTNSVCTALKGNIPKVAVSSGRGLCERMANNFNLLGTMTCSATASTITTSDTDFSAKTPNFTTSSGMIFFNLQTNPVSNVYTVYVDIDGEQRKSKLGDDVIAFNIRTDGLTLPVYGSKAATDTGYLSASIKADVSGSFSILSGTANLTYQNAYCGVNGTYLGTSCSNTYYTGTCSSASASCSVVLNKPTFFLFML